MKNGCIGIILYEFIFRIIGNFFPCQYKLGLAEILDRSPELLTADYFIRSSEIIKTKLPAY